MTKFFYVLDLFIKAVTISREFLNYVFIEMSNFKNNIEYYF